MVAPFTSMAGKFSVAAKMEEYFRTSTAADITSIDLSNIPTLEGDVGVFAVLDAQG